MNQQRVMEGGLKEEKRAFQKNEPISPTRGLHTSPFLSNIGTGLN